MANVKVRLLPLKSIGGVGNPGDEVWMSQEDAERYAADGYVEIVAEGSGQKAVGSELPAAEPEDHKIMKPQNKRSRKK